MKFKGLIHVTFLAITASSAVPAAAQCQFGGLADNYSPSDDAVTLTGTPAGGDFFGPGISGDRFDPATAGPGTHEIRYVHSDDYTVSNSGNFSPISSDSGWTTVPSGRGVPLQELDNGLSPPLNIGFDFHYFGESYDELYVSSNGDVTFSPYLANIWFPTSIPSRLPPNNMIALVRRNLAAESPVQGEIRYRIEGSAPNRIFVLQYEYIDPRSENAEGYGEMPDVVTQLKLFEATHGIEIHTTTNAADREASVQGIENRTGTRAYFIDNRDFGVWTAQNDFVSFTPCVDVQTVTVSGEAFHVGGTVSGLAEGSELELQNNGDNLIITRDGRFTFAESLQDGDAYDVVVATHPTDPEQTCSVTNGSGFIRGASVGDIAVSCSTETYTLTYSAGVNGRILGDVTQNVVDGGDGTEVRAVADSGYVFDGWSDGMRDNPRRDREVTGDITVTAQFAAAAQPEPEPEPDSDTVAPVITPEADLDVQATGLLTPLSDLTEPLAEDDRDGTVPVTLVTEQTHLRPGSHQITWAAQDAAGNQTVYEQRVLVHPVISLAMDQIQPPNGQAAVQFFLNGPAPQYPLTVGYKVASPDASPPDLGSGTVTFNEGEREQVVVLNLTDYPSVDNDERVIVTLDENTTTQNAANFGPYDTHTISIEDRNFAPTVGFEFYQGGLRSRMIARDRGAVRIVADVDDLNPEDSHTLDWGWPEGAAVEQIDDVTLELDPASLDDGLHHVTLTVQEDHASPLVTEDEKAFWVSETLPSLSNSSDADADGHSDSAEGIADAHSKALPAYLDPVDQSNVLTQKATDGFRYLIEAAPGAHLELNDYALRNGADGASIDPENLGDNENPGAEVDPDGTYVDFQMRSLPPGATARLVIPQRQTIPEGAAYRKFHNGVWTTFQENTEDHVASAPGAEGVCPPPGSPAYSEGLTPGDWCVQLTMTDGGPNDSDGEANGAIIDPGGVSVTSRNAYNTSGGGAVSFLSLALLAILGVGLRLGRYVKWRMSAVAVLVLTSVVGTTTSSPTRAAELITGYSPLYLSADVGYANTDLSPDSMDQRFAEAGYQVETASTNGSRSAWSVGVGYRATDRIALEIDYVNLGDVDVDFASEATGGELAEIHPESGHGGAIAARYRYPVTRQLGINGRLGVFIWQGDFETRLGDTRVGENQGRNEDFYYSLGVDYILSPAWSLGGELQRFEFANDPTHVLSVGLEFRFLEWLDPY